MRPRYRTVKSAALIAGALLGLAAHATVTNLVWYRLGENDTSPAANGAVPAATEDSFGGPELTLVGNAYYDTNVSSQAASQVGSFVGLHFTPGHDRGTTALLTTNIDNFGLELWVKPDTDSGAHVLAHNGITGTDGWGLRQVDTNCFGVLAGVTNFGTALVATNAWTHLALVRNNGLSTLYVNGVPSGTTTLDPGVPTVRFGIGGQTTGNPSSAYFQGQLDEVRVFTFAPGQFSTNDLLSKVSPPVVTTLFPTLQNNNGATMRGTVDSPGPTHVRLV